jgi:hypothetical protein
MERPKRIKVEYWTKIVFTDPVVLDNPLLYTVRLTLLY